MNSKLFEQEQSILNEAPSKVLIATHNGWNIYYSNVQNMGYKSHIHYRMDDKSRGNNFCTMDEFLNKIKRFINEYDKPTHYKNISQKQKLLGLNKNFIEVLFLFIDSGKKVPVDVEINPDYKNITVSTIFSNKTTADRLRYDGVISLKEQFEFIEQLKQLFL